MTQNPAIADPNGLLVLLFPSHKDSSNDENRQPFDIWFQICTWCNFEHTFSFVAAVHPFISIVLDLPTGSFKSVPSWWVIFIATPAILVVFNPAQEDMYTQSDFSKGCPSLPWTLVTTSNDWQPRSISISCQDLDTSYVPRSDSVGYAE